MIKITKFEPEVTDFDGAKLYQGDNEVTPKVTLSITKCGEQDETCKATVTVPAINTEGTYSIRIFNGEEYVAIITPFLITDVPIATVNKNSFVKTQPITIKITYSTLAIVKITYSPPLSEVPTSVTLQCPENTEKNFAFDGSKLTKEGDKILLTISPSTVPYPCNYSIKTEISGYSFTTERAFELKFESLGDITTSINEISANVKSIPFVVKNPILVKERLVAKLDNKELSLNVENVSDGGQTIFVILSNLVLKDSSIKIIIQDLFNPEEEAKEFEFTVKVSDLRPEKYLYYKNKNTLVKMYGSGYSNVYLKRDNQYITCEKSQEEEEVWTYEPTKDFEKLVVYYTKVGGSEKENAGLVPIYVFSSLSDLYSYTPLEECNYYDKEKGYSFVLTPTQEKVDETKFSVKLSSGTSTGSSNNLEYIFKGDLEGERDLQVLFEEEVILQEKIGFSSIEVLSDVSYIETSVGSVPIKASCNFGENSLYLEKGGALSCKNSVDNEYNCEYSASEIIGYGEQKIYYKKTSTEKSVKIYKSLSLANIDVSLQENGFKKSIKFTSDEIDLSGASVLYTEGKNEEKQNLENSEIQIKKDGVEYVIKELTLDNQKKTYGNEYSFNIPQVFYLKQSKYFVEENKETQTITVNIVFSSTSQIPEKILIGEKTGECTKTVGKASCKVALENLSALSSIAVSIEDNLYPKNIEIIKYSFGNIECLKSSDEKIKISFRGNVEGSDISVNVGNKNYKPEKTSSGSWEISLEESAFNYGSSYIQIEGTDISKEIRRAEEKKLSEGLEKIILLSSFTGEQEIKLPFKTNLSDEDMKVISFSFGTLKKCSISPSDQKLLVCVVTVGNSLENPNLKYQNICGEEKTIDLSDAIGFKEKTSIEILKVEGKYIKKTQTGEPLFSIELTEEVNSNDFKVELIKSKDDESPLQTEAVKASGSSTKISINKIINPEAGEYFVKFSENEAEAISKTKIIIFENNLELSKTDINVLENESTIAVEFSSLDEKLLGEIALEKGGEKLSFTYSISGKTITLENVKFSSDGTWTVSIEDLSQENKLKLTVKVFNKPTQISLEKTLVLYKQGESITTVDFGVEIIKDLIKSVQFSTGNVGIDLDVEVSAKEGELKFTSDYNPQSTQSSPIKFCLGSKGDYCLETVNSILVLTENLIPTSITSALTEKDSKSLEVTFNRRLYSELKDVTAITLSPRGNCKVSSIQQTKMTVTCEEAIATPRTLTVTFFNEIRLTYQFMECQSPKFLKIVDGVQQCLSCSEIGQKLYESNCVTKCPKGTYLDEDNECKDNCDKLIEGEDEVKCVSTCSEGYGVYGSESKECVYCKDGISIDGSCEKECPTGTFKNSNNDCVLPENIPDQEVNLCDGYCQNNGNCTLVNKVPTCTCNGFVGMQCEYKEEEREEVSRNIFSSFVDSIDPNNGGTLNNKGSSNRFVRDIREVTSFVKDLQKDDTIINEKDKVDILINATKNKIKEINNQDKPINNEKGFIHLVGLSLLSFVKRYHHSKRNQNPGLRNLQNSEKEEIYGFINQTSEFLEKLGRDSVSTENPVYTETDSTEYLTVQGSMSDAKSIGELKQQSKDRNVTFADLSECLSGKDDYKYVISDISNEVMKILESESNSNKVNVKVYDKDGNDQDSLISQCKRVLLELPTSDTINKELYSYYKQRNIDIYKIDDPAFKPCFFSNQFDYDLTQKYRKNFVYQGYQFAPSTGCAYETLDLELQKVVLVCEGTANVSYSLTPSKIENSNHVDNLPTKCASDIDDIQDNIAFWLFLILFVLFIICDATLAVFSCKTNNITEALENDELLDNYAFEKVKGTESAAKVEDVKVSVKTKSEIFISNFKSLHPLSSLFRASVITPQTLTIGIFVYNIFNLFGFNALYFNETMIEDRIYDSFRNNFAYPMKTEFEKIMASIATTIALNIIVRSICLVTLNKKIELGGAVQKSSGDQRIGAVKEFHKSYLARWIISGVFMLALSVFFFYYCVVFCGIYIKTQYGWFYSGIWSLMWNWIAFAPIYITIISLVEMSNSNCAYYMKRLFIF